MKKIKEFLHLRSVRAVFICLLLSIFGIVGGFYTTKHVIAATKSRFEKLELFNKVLYLIETQYYKEVDTEKLIQGAIRGMMDTLDPHSAFLDKDVFEKMQEDTQGEFGGIGVEVTQKDGIIIIITPIEDSPAYRAGIHPGDKIVEINHESIIGFTLDKAIEKMKGGTKSKLILGISRDGVEGIKQFELQREIIKTKPVKSYLVDKNVGLLRLTQFQKDLADHMAKEIESLKSQASKNGGLNSIILDLRYNPGGLLEEAVNVASVFLEGGIVVSTEGRNSKEKEIRYVKKTGYKELKLPVGVLINGATASASEIVAGALQDAGRAVIMGTRSFGKGSVQTVSKIDNDTGVKLTIAQYMTPKGRKIQAIGIVPDVELPEYNGDIEDFAEETEFTREIDLRNHLTATEETADEKKLREEKENAERLQRIKRFQEDSAVSNNDEENDKKKRKKNKNQDIFLKYDPVNDFQVQQAIKFIKGIGIVKKLSF